MSWFYEKKHESLRNELEGADTAIWLATSEDERITKRENNGKFWFDRSIVKENFPFAWTTNTQAEVDDLWNYCVEAFCHSPSV